MPHFWCRAYGYKMQEKTGTKDASPPQPVMWMEAFPSKGCLAMLRHNIFSLGFSPIIETLGIMAGRNHKPLHGQHPGRASLLCVSRQHNAGSLGLIPMDGGAVNHVVLLWILSGGMLHAALQICWVIPNNQKHCYSCY